MRSTEKSISTRFWGVFITMVAKQQLSEEYPENPFFKSVLADVYVGLSDEESLRLARHNTTSHFVHKVTHRDMVSTVQFIVMSKKIPFPNNITSHTIIVNNSCIGWLVLYT